MIEAVRSGGVSVDHLDTVVTGCGPENGGRGKSVCVMTSVHAADDTRILLKECRSIAKAGYRVTLIAARGNAPATRGVEVRLVRGSQGRIARATLTVMRVMREAFRARADIYHFHDPELAPVGLLLVAAGKKVVFDVHEDIPRDILSKDYLPADLRPLLSRGSEVVLRVVCRAFSGVIAATPAIAELFSSAFINTSVVQNFPLENELVSTRSRSWSEREPAIAYVGGITAIRAAREMVMAMGCVPPAVKARLKIAGAFSPDGLQDELTTLKGWERVECVGVLSRTAVADLLGDVQAGLVLFLPDPCHVSAYPTKMFEYMSAGIPVIASNFPLWKTIIEEAGCGLTVDPRDPQAIAEAVTYLLKHPQEAEQMGRRGQEAVRTRYNWSREEQHLLSFYSSLK